MPTSKQLREQRMNIWEQMKEVNDRTGDAGLSAEDRQKYDELETKFDGLLDEVERMERHEAAEKSMDTLVVPGQPAPLHDASRKPGKSGRDEAYATAFTRFLRDGILDLDPGDRKILQAGFRQDPDIKAAAGTGTGSAGGYTVPPEFRDKFVETLKWYGPMLREAEVIVTDSGANLQWPTNDDTANVGAILSENTQVTEQDLVFGTASLDAYMYTSKLVRVSYQLLQDSAIDIDSWLPRKLGERIGRILNQHFTTGTGTAQPDGLVTGATVGVTSTGSFASTGGISYDNLVDLVEAIDPAYGNAAEGTGEAPGLKFMGHQSVRKAARKLKDGSNRPLWEPSIQAGAPDTLLGHGFAINNDMATLAQSSKSLAFGNLKQAYVVRLTTDLATLRLTERYADFLQVGFLGFQRADGTLQDANAVRVLQTTATA